MKKENYKNLLKDLMSQAEECDSNNDYMEKEGYNELYDKFGEAFASCILDIRQCLSVIAYAYMLSKLKDEEVLFNNPKLED